MIVGLFVGKFLPLHIGHINAIKKASNACDKLFVVVGDDPIKNKKLCDEAHLPFIDLKTKTEWVKAETKNIKNVVVVPFDESGIKSAPFGWEEWSEKLKELLKEKVDIIFGSEENYASYYKKYFSESKYVLQDKDRKEVNISSTKIRSDIKKYFDYIAPSAKPFFEKYLK